MIIVLAILFAVAQVADFATYHPSYEANGLVLAAGPYAVWLKVGLVAYVTIASIEVLRAKRHAWVASVLMAMGAAAGLLGTVTNLMSRG